MEKEKRTEEDLILENIIDDEDFNGEDFLSLSEVFQFNDEF